jgi:translation factor GUF1, mitochondrial
VSCESKKSYVVKSLSLLTPEEVKVDHGFRVGFLGLLHLEVFVQRLEQEYQAEPIITAPSVSYKIRLKPAKAILNKYGGEEMLTVSNPKLLPDTQHIEEYFEPTV